MAVPLVEQTAFKWIAGTGIDGSGDTIFVEETSMAHSPFRRST